MRPLLPLAIGVGLALIHRTVSACSWAPEVPVLNLPVEGAVDVPTNTRIWASGFAVDVAVDDLVLRADDGTEVELDAVLLGAALVATPVATLAPQTAYTLVVCGNDGCVHEVRTFVTGAGTDTDPPSRPIEVERRERSGRACGRIRWFDVEFDFEGVLVVDFGIPEIDADAILGADATITTESLVVVHDSGGSEAARAGAWDVAGNFSGWVELETFDALGCGCAADRPWTAWWIAVLPWLPRRRRALTVRGVD